MGIKLQKIIKNLFPIQKLQTGDDTKFKVKIICLMLMRPFHFYENPEFMSWRVLLWAY